MNEQNGRERAVARRRHQFQPRSQKPGVACPGWSREKPGISDVPVVGYGRSARRDQQRQPERRQHPPAGSSHESLLAPRFTKDDPERYDPRFNRSVVVSAAAISEALDKVYGQQRLVKELTGR
jgi:hypothetical protein